MLTGHYDVLAGLFAHPNAGFENDVALAIVLYSGRYSRAAHSLREFQRFIPSGDLDAMRELHTRTFDVQAITSLDIGYTLFGEDYKRGALLAHLSAEHTKAKVDCGTELADHLSNVLRLLPRLADEALRDEFVRVLLAPALREMILEFEPERLCQKEDLYKKHHKTIIEVAVGEARTMYRHALEAVMEVLRVDFALRVNLPIDQESKFVRSVGTEMCIDGSLPCAQQPERGAR